MEAERRQITVLFADMVGFTSYSERSGEEAAYTLMRSLSKLMDGAVREQGGVVQVFTGDGIMAVFGAPVAFEDAPLRACRAALTILQRLKAARPDLETKHGVQPQLRIGLNTGAAVIGRVQEGAEAQITVLGDTVNFASRLQALAEPDAIFLSEATHRLVQGMVEASFVGEKIIKGKTEPQKIYRLDGIRQGVSRFEAALSRGLTTFVGREHELEVLERAFDGTRAQLRLVDLAGDPGMGKSRLLHELRQRIGKERAFMLLGNCSPDGQQTPFLPFIEVVRSSFRLSEREAESDIAQKLEMGLTALGLHSRRNRGLLVHLLGLKVPDDSLAGLDGVLIGLRTRELLQQLLEARCRLSTVIMVIEDLHWIDSVSEELLNKIIDSEAKSRLLVLTTRRPEYSPPWLDRSVVTKLLLEALPIGDIRRLIRGRLGAEALPESAAWQVAEKSEGNPLFAEEIVSFLSERGIVPTTTGKLDFDATALATALPATLQSLLTARVDRLAPSDRVFLQAASVIGRQFDPQLLAVVVGNANIHARLTAMHALDLVYRESKSGDYSFKHALVRDALYQSLLSEARAALHLRIAEEIERRSGNRLAEVAEALAHHYSQTNRADKAFTYLSMAGSKGLRVYSVDEASAHFAAALTLLDKNPDCASDDQVAEFIQQYALLLLIDGQISANIDVVERYLPRIKRLGDDQKAVLIRHYYVWALLMHARNKDAAEVQRELSPMAERLGDSRSKAYALAAEIFVSTIVAPKPLDEYEILKQEAIAAASNTTDAGLQTIVRWAIGWEEMFRGRMNDARVCAHELIQVGQVLNDPRNTGNGLWVLSYIALLSDSFAEALEYSEQSIAVSLTRVDLTIATNNKACALVLLRQTEEGAALLEQCRRRFFADGFIYCMHGSDPIFGLCKILQGNIRGGIRFIEEAISQGEKEGNRSGTDLFRLHLAAVYLQIIMGSERPPFQVLLKNLPILLQVMATATSRIRALVRQVLENPHFHPDGHHVGRAQMILGLLYKAKKNRALAVQHLTEAKRIFSQFGQTPILARVETALAELRQ